MGAEGEKSEYASDDVAYFVPLALISTFSSDEKDAKTTKKTSLVKGVTQINGCSGVQQWA